MPVAPAASDNSHSHVVSDHWSDTLKIVVVRANGHSMPRVDVIVVSRSAKPLRDEVEQGLRNQSGVDITVHRILGDVRPQENCRFQTIARARNEGTSQGTAPWLMYVDDDVVLAPDCVRQLIQALEDRPAFAALAADYLGESREGQVAPHVAMGATLFRREVFQKLKFTWGEDRCECQCCCDDLRRLHQGIDYWPAAKAQHLARASDATAAAHHFRGREPLNSPARVKQMSQPAKICLVVCYFGPLPPWINYYLRSCAYSPTINFLILTDQESLPAAPPNVRFKRFTRAEFNRLATAKIGVSIHLGRSHKLCDFKPTYGHLFEDLLSKYDYWGYTDLDVIYGDLRSHLTSASLEQYDVFTARKEYLVGHFTLFRNTPQMRALYRQCAGFQAILQIPQVMSFDECGHQWEKLWTGEKLSEYAACDSMTHTMLRLQHREELSACMLPSVLEWPELPDEDWQARWTAGKLYSADTGVEAMYLHFHAFKFDDGYQHPAALGDCNDFEISAQGFHPIVAECSSGGEEQAIKVRSA